MTAREAVAVAPPSASYARIGRIAAPMVFSTASATVTQVVVLALIGHIGGSALYVRAVYTPVGYLFLAVTTGLAVTVQVLVAQASGRGETSAAGSVLGSVGRAGAVAYAVTAATLLALSDPLCALVGVDVVDRGEFHAFLAAMTAASVVSMFGELCSASLRGLGRTGISALITASYVVLIIAIVAIGVAAGAGLMILPVATVAASVLEIFLGMIALRRATSLPATDLLRWRSGTLRILTSVGIPVAVSSAFLAIVNVLMLRIVSPAGPDHVAGFTIGWTLQTAVIVPAVALGSAIAVVMNRELAADGQAAAREVLRRGVTLTLTGYAAITVLVVLVAKPVSSLMSNDPAVTEAAAHFLRIVGPTFGCTGAMLTLLTVLEQVGHGMLAVAMNLIYYVPVLALGWWLVRSQHHEVGDLYWTMVAVSLVCLATGLPLAVRYARRPVLHG